MASLRFCFNDFSLTRRVWGVMIVNGLALVVVMAAAGWALMQARASISALHADRMVASEHINGMVQDFYDTRLNVLLGYQHDPKSALYALHGHDLSTHTSVVDRNEASSSQRWKQLQSRALDATETELMQKIEGQQGDWYTKAREAANRLNSRDFSPESMQQFLVAGRTEGDALLKSLTTLQKYQSQKADEAAQQAEERFQQLLWIMGAILVFLMLPGLALMLFTMRRLSNGLTRAVATAKSIAAGDLSGSDSDPSKDEIGDLITNMRRMRDNLNDVIHRIVVGANSIAHAADDVTSGTQDLASRTEQQAAALEETSAATEELNSTVHHNADNAMEVDKMAAATASLAERGGDVTQHAVSTMETIRAASEKIGNIVNIIDGIAFQTNILALNAAVEAARAGEAGKGFAVVAAEVRALAQRSAAAANEIKGVIQESVEGIRGGSEQVSEVGVAMAEIVESFRRMTTLINEIASASKEQALGLQQINEAVNHMDSMTQRNATLVESTLRTSETLQLEAASFRELVSTFRLAGDVSMKVEYNQPQYLAPAAAPLGLPA